ncbi:hypothetical protein Pcinc_043093 [Petrolisthes cinctipes]|uniref:Uncharacterized protein n=1 Tax=Petrolisthes cinctipes TaxID=88211 RepID=A0AAE1EGJ8_PETCI|nr:hypothetical protein Pcinc_043093 [Petrolisthes cinctipes]
MAGVPHLSPHTSFLVTANTTPFVNKSPPIPFTPYPVTYYAHTTPPHTTLTHKLPHTTPHHSTPHHSNPHHTTHHSTPLNPTPHHSTPHHSTPHHSTPHHSTPHHSTPHHSTPHHSTPHHSTPHHSTPHHSTPHHSTPHNATPHNATPHTLRSTLCYSPPYSLYLHNTSTPTSFKPTLSCHVLPCPVAHFTLHLMHVCHHHTPSNPSPHTLHPFPSSPVITQRKCHRALYECHFVTQKINTV